MTQVACVLARLPASGRRGLMLPLLPLEVLQDLALVTCFRLV